MLVIDYICEKLDRLKVSDVIRSINIVAFIIILNIVPCGRADTGRKHHMTYVASLSNGCPSKVRNSLS